MSFISSFILCKLWAYRLREDVGVQYGIPALRGHPSAAREAR
jgi:hypothetical protein